MQGMLDLATLGFFIFIGGLIWVKDSPPRYLLVASITTAIGVILMFACLLCFINTINPNWMVN